MFYQVYYLIAWWDGSQPVFFVQSKNHIIVYEEIGGSSAINCFGTLFLDGIVFTSLLSGFTPMYKTVTNVHKVNKQSTLVRVKIFNFNL